MLQLGQWLADATPEAISLGGARRLLFVGPRSNEEKLTNWTQRLAEESEQEPNAIVGNDHAVAICCETDSTPLRNVVAGLVGPRPDYIKLAERLHTRIDVEWPDMRE